MSPAYRNAEFYRRTSIQTATSGELVLSLLNGAELFLERAKLGFEKEELAEANEIIFNNVTRAQDIFGELNRSLNMDEGGRFSANMRGLYTYFRARLDESCRQHKRDGVDEVLEHTRKLRDAWAQMLQQSNSANNLESEPLLAEG